MKMLQYMNNKAYEIVNLTEYEDRTNDEFPIQKTRYNFVYLYLSLSLCVFIYLLWLFDSMFMFVCPCDLEMTDCQHW